MSERCGNCIWFKGEPQTPINPSAPVVKEQGAKKFIGEKIALRGAVGLLFMENAKQFFKMLTMKPKSMTLEHYQVQVVLQRMI